MAYLDLLLNIIGLLLWVSWRTLSVATASPAPLTLASTIRPADRRQGRRWLMLGLLPVLLVGRALFYWQLGGPLDWTPKLPLGLLVVSFKCETIPRYLLYSLLSFGLFFAVAYFALLLLSAVQGRPLEPDPPTRYLRQLLGRPARWPAGVQLLLPFPLTMAAWPLLQMLFQYLKLLPPVSDAELAMDSLRFGLAVILAWKYVLVAVLALHFINTYVHLGPGSFWPFIARTGRTLLLPLRWLRLGKLDLAPLAGIALVFALCWPIERWPEWWRPAPAPPAVPAPAARQ